METNETNYNYKVYCDICGKDYTRSACGGGMIAKGFAYCIRCITDPYPRNTWPTRSFDPSMGAIENEDKTFADFVRDLREGQ